jgi:hypothetical protein
MLMCAAIIPALHIPARQVHVSAAWDVTYIAGASAAHHNIRHIGKARLTRPDAA